MLLCTGEGETGGTAHSRRLNALFGRALHCTALQHPCLRPCLFSVAATARPACACHAVRRDGIVALSWHPSPAPMQLLTLSTTGCIDVWAKVRAACRLPGKHLESH